MIRRPHPFFVALRGYSVATKIKLSDLSNYLLKATGAEFDDIMCTSKSHSECLEKAIQFLLDFNLLDLSKIELEDN